MISLEYRKAVYHCFSDSHAKSEFLTRVSGITSILVYDTHDGTDMSDIFALRDELGEYFEPKPVEEAK